MILERNTRIIFRRLNGKGMLYDPDHRKTMMLNPAGTLIYTGLKPFTDAEKLLDEFSGNDAEKRREAEYFLDELQKSGFITGFSTDLPEVPERPQSTSAAAGQFGIGFSMSGTFFPGDQLITVPADPAQLRCGDVICFTVNNRRTAHRIIGGTAGAWITMGDNNPAPDRQPVTSDDLQLVTMIIRNGENIPVPGGEAGMRHFRQWRRKRFWRLLLKKLLQFPARAAVGCCFWRKTPERVTEFGKVIQYSDGGKIIGWRIRESRVFTAHRLKFLYRLP